MHGQRPATFDELSSLGARLTRQIKATRIKATRSINNYIDLLGTPSTFAESAGKFAKVNSEESSIEFADFSAADLPAHAVEHESGGGDAIDHDSLSGFVANEHINHTSVTLTAGDGLTGGGDISASRTFNVDVGIADNKIVQIDSASVADNDYAKFTANGLEGRSYSEVRADLSVPDKTSAAWSKTIGSGGDYATWAAMVADLPGLIAHEVTITIKTGTTLTETCDLKNKSALTSDTEITIQAEDYFPQGTTVIPTASSATATTLVDSGQAWAVDRFIGCWVLVVDGTGTDNGFVKITDSDATSITVASWPGTQPDNTSRYRIVGALIDGEAARNCMPIEDNGVTVNLYGIGFDDAVNYGITARSASIGQCWHCGFYGAGRAGVYLEKQAIIDIRYSGIVNCNTSNLAWQAGIAVYSLSNISNLAYCGISDNNRYGVQVRNLSFVYANNNFGDGNGTWGLYCRASAQAYLQGTECSGSSGNHSDPGTAGTAGEDQASAYN